ncbi:MAG: F0F1 ATP synthase subunit A [bacterium]|nr:F0F1 ATP synthase subunit A [bacterium]MBU1917883.1 F0F1 ATP synthase subunit A [bacterium]
MLLSADTFLLVPYLTKLLTGKTFPLEYLHIAHGLIVLVILFIFSLLYRFSLKKADDEIIPDGKVSLKNIFQVAVEQLLDLMKSIIPHHAQDYFPLIGTIFIYIFISNLMGIIPGFLPPTENVNTNFAVAITVFVYYNYIGFSRTGFKNYIQHFIGPNLGSSIGMILFRILFMAPLLFLIEVLGHFMRPVSLSFRLFGNIYGDHMVLSTFSDMAPILVPVVFLGFGIFVSFIQAFVFTLLSTVYIGLAVEVHDH